MMNLIDSYYNNFSNYSVYGNMLEQLLRYQNELGKEINPNHKPYKFKEYEKPAQPRNELCNCGSGMKYKHCCGKVKEDRL